VVLANTAITPDTKAAPNTMAQGIFEKFSNNTPYKDWPIGCTGGFWYVLFDWIHSGTKKTPEDMALLLDKVMSINNKEFFINEYKRRTKR